LLPIMLPNASLWAAGEHGAAAGEESPLLVERLRARLGDEAVYGLCLVPEHRPERASVSAEPSLRETAAKWTMGFASMGIRRPLWLLRAPVAMPLAPQGLQLIEGPERIETGWWDGSEVARDYYIARDVRGAELWVFRERESPHAWFLHGVLA
jgi:protein ImuB